MLLDKVFFFQRYNIIFVAIIFKMFDKFQGFDGRKFRRNKMSGPTSETLLQILTNDLKI